MLEREQPALYARLCRAFGAHRVNVSIGAEHVQIVGDGAALAVLPRLPTSRQDSAGVIWVESELGTIVSVLEAEAALLDVVWDDRVRVFGALDDLLAMHDALGAYLQAAVRCVSAPRLLQSFRERMRGRLEAAVPTASPLTAT
jgi:hypothetical protein